MFDRLFLPMQLGDAYKDKDGQEAAIVLLVKGAESPRLMHDPEAVPAHAAR